MYIILFLFGLTVHAFTPAVSKNGSNLKWNVSEVPYKINFDGNHGLNRDEIEEAITQSSAVWKHVNGSNSDFHFIYEGESKESSTENLKRGELPRLGSRFLLSLSTRSGNGVSNRYSCKTELRSG